MPKDAGTIDWAVSITGGEETEEMILIYPDSLSRAQGIIANQFCKEGS